MKPGDVVRTIQGIEPWELTHFIMGGNGAKRWFLTHARNNTKLTSPVWEKDLVPFTEQDELLLEDRRNMAAAIGLHVGRVHSDPLMDILPGGDAFAVMNGKRLTNEQVIAIGAIIRGV